MSYSVKETNNTGQHEILIRMISGWVLGKGPCGPTCDKSDIGRDTRLTRKIMETANTNTYFGQWFEEYLVSSGIHATPEITNDIASSMTEKVIGVSETAKWEQSMMEARVILNVTKDEVDISYVGQSWRNRTNQKGNISAVDAEKWNVQTTVKLGIRVDTGKPNQSPKAVIKPYYRLKLDEVNEIHIAAIDGDDDYVKCKKSLFSEALSVSVNPLEGLNILDSCTVTLNASTALGYSDNFWGSIAVTVRDFLKHSTKIGTRRLIPGYSVSGTPVQFLVQVLEHLEIPTFVKPTLENNHEFIVYVGVVWSADVYAEAVENTTIDEFVSFGFENENISLSQIKDDELNRERVKQIQVSWKPEPGDVGRHVVCTRVIDNTGVDSSEDKCFIVNVKGSIFTSSAIPVGQARPYFFNLPAASENVSCKVDMTCALPMYVKSNTEVDTIRVTITAIDTTYFSTIFTSETDVYQTDLFMRHSGYGVQTICLMATDINGLSSDEVCINVDIDPPDPCYSSPCQNSGECVRRPLDKSDYECIHCPPGFSGKNCQRREADFCHPNNPCENGKCVARAHKCYCLSSGFIGPTCSIDKDNCQNINCNNHGICKDGINNHTCNCFKRYAGPDCQIDQCNMTSPASETCPGDIPGCAPNACQHGVCIKHGNCLCQLGYTADDKCSQAVGDIRTKYSNLTILPPTPEPRSTTVCYKNEACDIDIYFTSGNRATTDITVYKKSEALEGKYGTSSIEAWNEINSVSGMFKVSITLTSDIIPYGYICAVVMDSSSSDFESRCFAVKITDNPETIKDSLEYKQQNNAIKFLEPTLRGESTIVCRKDTPCYLLLYTSKTGTGACDKPISTDDGVSVLNVKPMSTACLTQTSVLIDTPGNHHICFQSTLVSSDAQKRCFVIQVYGQDPCSTTRCQNSGECLYTDDILGNTTCECQLNYGGSRCEKGPCQQNVNTCHKGYCEVNDHVTQCMCPIGYNGALCEKNFPDAITNLAGTGAQFTDVALPEVVMCIRNRLCSVPIIASGHYSGNEKPDIRPGYTSTSVNFDNIDTNHIENGTYAVNVNLFGRRVGLHDVCILSMNRQGINMDELCFKVNVTEATSTLYSDEDTPHFTAPSVPTNSELICKVDEPCHLLFNATPGDLNIATECVTLTLTPSSSVKSHIYSSCDTCVLGSREQLHCLFDVVLYVNTDVDLCIEATTTQTGVVGEKRCFKLSTASHIANKGCQIVHCENGGFCDGHVEPAKCHCPAKYSGPTCHTDESSQSSTGMIQPLTGGGGVPNEVICYINKPCLIPHQSLDPRLSLTTGYISPGVKVNPSSVIPGSPDGAIQIDSSSPGEKTVCLQALQSSSVEDEMCMTVKFAASGGPVTDQARPYFLPPTFPKDTTIMCNANETCHLDIHFSKGIVFNSNQLCPTLSESSLPPVDGIYIFPGTANPSDCTSDISYITPDVNSEIIERLCIEVFLPGIRGEERCFILQVVRNITNKVPGPCAGMTCQHGAVCIADTTANPPVGNCICRHGYEGLDCSQAVPPTNSLPGFVDPSGNTPPHPQSGTTPYFDPSSGIPTNIACIENQPCVIQIPYRGAADRPPLPGYLASAVNITGTSVVSTPTNGLHIASYSINNTHAGVHKTCLQTTVNGSIGGVNLDEICFNVTVSAGSSTSHNPQTTSPFDNGAFTNGSTMTCQASTVCQLSVLTKGSPNCTDIQECGSGLPGVHVFGTHQQGTVCITSVAIKTGLSNTVQDLCLSAGPNGDQRHIQVEATNKAEYGPCQRLHCRNEGFCNGKDASPVCECKNDYSGLECEIVTGNCSGEVAVVAKKRAETVVKEGRVSCFCKFKDLNNVERKVQIIKRRPQMPISYVLKHAGFGAGGVSGVIVIVMVLYCVVKKVKKPAGVKRDPVNRVHKTPQWYVE